MLKVISQLLISAALTLSWSNATIADTPKVVWKYGFNCGAKTVIVGDTEDGWALWGSPNSDIGTTYDGWMWTTDDGTSTSYLRSLQDGRDVLDIESDGAYERYECTLVPNVTALMAQ